MKPRFFLNTLVVSLALSASIFGHSGAANAYTLEQALMRIDMSGGQRMLAQRMAGLSCLIHMNIDAETHALEALDAAEVYSNTLKHLLNGNPSVGLPPEDQPRVLDAIKQAREGFVPMQNLLAVFEGSSSLSIQRLEAIATQSTLVFESSKHLTNQIQATSTRALEDLPLISAMIINISGRQRMLAEQAFKAFCLSQAGIEVERNLEELDKTTTIFDNTLSALISGMPGVILPPPNEDVRAKLQETREVWVPVKAILERALAGERLGYEELHFTTEELETIRMLMNEAVKLYEKAEES